MQVGVRVYEAKLVEYWVQQWATSNNSQASMVAGILPLLKGLGLCMFHIGGHVFADDIKF